MKRSLTISLVGVLLLSSLPVMAFSQESQNLEDEMADLENLLNVLEEQTEIATKTRMNIDFVPGLVTVLHGKDMMEKGVQSVWAALRFVPGIEPSLDKTGGKQVLVRGVGGGFGSGNMKLMLNGVPLNATLAATADPVLNMPIEQIKQIEVIRGPGSAVHGEFAYAGVINVITHTELNQTFARAGSFDTYVLGGMGKWQPKHKKWSLSYNFSAGHSQGNRQFYADDALWNNPSYTGTQAQTNTPGYTNEDLQERTFLMDFVHGDYGLSFKYLEDGHGDFYGTVHALSEENSGISYRNRYVSLEGRAAWDVAENGKLDTKAGWVHYSNFYDIMLMPYYQVNVLGVIYPNGYNSVGKYNEDKIYLNGDFSFQFGKHDLMAGFAVSHLWVGESWQENNVTPAGVNLGTVMQRFTYEDGLKWPSQHWRRTVMSLSAQDAYRVNDDITITGGIRLDHYDDFGASITPRLAGVWRLNDKHILKAQYAQSFRPPTFYEMSWDQTLQPQRNHTAELSYIFKGVKNELRGTLFTSRLKNTIRADSLVGFVASSGVHQRGVEVEGVHRVNSRLKFEGNASYVYADDQENNIRSPGAADKMANLSVTYEPTDEMTITSWLRHVGKRYREYNDTRTDLEGYETLSLTWTVRKVLNINGLTLRAGVDNLFDELVRYPALLAYDDIPRVLGAATGDYFPSYNGDRVRPGRTFWVGITKSF
ncbi:TonB-dependent receptor plug domain-containing protein [Magnetococcus sp. PR-3]|uniref:TonB-dependent receptor plug domain-containing protein n=1 Tax=Magnetococcus sp. PR-3 TaxID=3120355 RepID=UPI002FCE3090